MSDVDKLTPDEAFSNMMTNVSGALGELLKICLTLDKRENEIRIMEFMAAMEGKQSAIAIPIEVISELTCLVPLLLFIFEEAPEVMDAIKVPASMRKAIATSEYRPDVKTREALSRLFKQVAGVEA